MAKNLKYFMRKEEDVETVVTVPGPETIKDDEGNVIQLEVKVLSAEHIRRINDNYHTRTIALDKKGNPYINAGNVVFRDERDNAKATRHIICDALVYPNLRDPELMKFYNCVDITEMPEKGSAGRTNLPQLPVSSWPCWGWAASSPRRRKRRPTMRKSKTQKTNCLRWE